MTTAVDQFSGGAKVVLDQGLSFFVLEQSRQKLTGYGWIAREIRLDSRKSDAGLLGMQRPEFDSFGVPMLEPSALAREVIYANLPLVVKKIISSVL